MKFRVESVTGVIINFEIFNSNELEKNERC